MELTRERAWALLTEFTKSPHLLKHALAVEAGVRAYAGRFGADEELWGAVALIHDFDYEIHPTMDRHPVEGSRILRERGLSEEVIRAVLSHAKHTGVEPITPLEKTLFAVDELVGFIIAVALVRPSKSIHEVDVAAVKKKLKDKAFARAVNRDEVREGAEKLGVPLDEHIAFLIEALKGAAGELGLQGIAAG